MTAWQSLSCSSDHQWTPNVYLKGEGTLILLGQLRSAAKLSHPYSVNPTERNVPPQQEYWLKSLYIPALLHEAFTAVSLICLQPNDETPSNYRTKSVVCPRSFDQLIEALALFIQRWCCLSTLKNSTASRRCTIVLFQRANRRSAI